MRNIVQKIKAKLLGTKKAVEDLEMIYPTTAKETPKFLLKEGYSLVIFTDEYRDGFLELIDAADMSGCNLDFWLSIALPDGFFLIIENVTGQVVGACLAAHKPNIRNAYGGCLGWLAVHPKHRGHKLGFILSANVVDRLKLGGYHNIYLGTQDFRLPAIITYLKLGWIPNIYSEEMYIRWRNIYDKLNMYFPYTFKESNKLKSK